MRDAIANDPQLTPEQRQALLNVYESFVAANDRERLATAARVAKC